MKSWRIRAVKNGKPIDQYAARATLADMQEYAAGKRLKMPKIETWPLHHVNLTADNTLVRDPQSWKLVTLAEIGGSYAEA